MICAIPDISRLFVTNCLPQWLDVLEHLQLIHWQKRELFAHVAYEDASTWMHAFNLSLGITALFDYLCNWFVHCSSAQTNVKESTSTTKDHSVRIPQIGVKDLLSAVLDRCIRWLEQNCSTEYLIACCNKVDATVFPRTLVTHEYSFHIPMHRFFAHIIFEASKHQHLVHCLESIFITLTHNDTASAVLLHHVLRPIVLNRQIKRNMWRRNGMNMYDQVMNYSEIPYSRVFRDLDFLLVQSCAVAVSTSTLLRYIFASFGVLEYSFPEEFVVEDHSLMDYVPDLISDTLHFIINLVTETPVEPRSHSSDRLRPLLRRELIQVLTSGPLTYSKLQESISTFYEADKLSSDIIDDIILGVGNKINPISLTAAPMYNLKKELWSEYDPCFPRLSDTMHSKALENRIKCTTNVAIVPPPLSAHPCFATLRAKILFDFHTLLVIRNFVYITASACTTKPIYLKLCDSWPFKSSDKLLSKLTQLLTLCIHEAKQQTDCDSFVQGVTAESRVHEQTGPSLMQGLVDIYNANQASVLGNEYYYLGWVIDQLLLLSPVCQEHYNFIMQSAGSKQDINQRNNMNELKVRSQQQAMSSIQQAAAQFLSMLDDISSSDEEDDMENKKQDAASENIDINEDNADNSMDVESGRESTSGQDGPSPQPGYNSLQQDDADDVDQLDFGQDVFDQKTKRTRKNSEAFQECESEEVCIICQSDVNTQQEDFLGYLGLVQASTVLQPCQETTFTALPNKTKVDSSHILRKNCGDCNLRIGLCGHQMHQSCFNKYFASQQIKSVTQEFMIFDASQGFFYCPLCRKLCNFLLPNVQPLSVDPVTMPTDNEESTKPWLDRVAFVRNKVGNISWESPFIERGESASVDLLLRPSIHHRLAR